MHLEIVMNEIRLNLNQVSETQPNITFLIFFHFENILENNPQKLSN